MVAKRCFFTVIISFCSSLLTFGQTYSSIIQDQEIIQFMNDMLQSDDFEKFVPNKGRLIIKKLVNWQHSSFVKITKNDSMQGPALIGSSYLFNRIADNVINKSDLDYFLVQKQAIKAEKWKNKFFNSKFIRIARNNKVFKHFYSIPLFSLDKTKAIIYKGFIKDELTRGFGYYIYHKVNGKWVLLEPLMQIQS